MAPRQAALPAVKLTNWPQERDRRLRPRPAGERRVSSLRRPRIEYTLVRRRLSRPDRPAADADEADAFVHDKSPDAYEKLVDRCSRSPHYGERWARRWLDLARYADTNGYEKDRPRTIWPYRDWVINALNADMPFDQFTIEQLAGDMLPGATLGAERSPPAFIATRCSTRKAASIRSSFASTRCRPRRHHGHRLARADARLLPSATRTSSIRSRTREYYQLWRSSTTPTSRRSTCRTRRSRRERSELETQIATAKPNCAQFLPDRWRRRDDPRSTKSAARTWKRDSSWLKSRAREGGRVDAC